MPEDIELLRLKAKARAKRDRDVGQQSVVQSQTVQPEQLLAITQNPSLITGAEQLRKGNIVGGLGNVAAGAVQGAMSPLTTADQLLRQVPYVGKLASNLINSPMNLLGDIKREVIHPVVSALGIDENAGMKPETAQGLSNAISTIAPLAVAKPLGQMTSQGLARGSQAIGSAMNQRGINKATAEIKRVAPPTVRELNYDKSLKRAEPYIAEIQRLNPIDRKSDVSPVRQATNLVAEAKSKLWDEKITPQIERHATETVDGTIIAEQIRSSLTDYVKNHEPALANRIEEYAKTFDGQQINLKQAAGYIKELNAKTRTYQKSSDVIKAQMETADPNIAAKVQAVETLRDAVYKKLEGFNEKDVRQLRQDYGALSDIHKALERKIVPAERDATSSSFYMKPFGTAVAGAATLEGFLHAPKTTIAAGGMGLVRRILIDRNKPNPTITRGFERLGKSDLTPRQVYPPMESASTNVVPPDIFYNGAQDMGGGKSYPMYTDKKTGSTFIVQPTETIAQALARIRKPYGL